VPSPPACNVAAWIRLGPKPVRLQPAVRDAGPPVRARRSPQSRRVEVPNEPAVIRAKLLKRPRGARDLFRREYGQNPNEIRGMRKNAMAIPCTHVGTSSVAARPASVVEMPAMNNTSAENNEGHGHIDRGSTRSENPQPHGSGKCKQAYRRRTRSGQGGRVAHVLFDNKAGNSTTCRRTSVASAHSHVRPGSCGARKQARSTRDVLPVSSPGPGRCESHHGDHARATIARS